MPWKQIFILPKVACYYFIFLTQLYDLHVYASAIVHMILDGHKKKAHSDILSFYIVLPYVSINQSINSILYSASLYTRSRFT